MANLATATWVCRICACMPLLDLTVLYFYSVSQHQSTVAAMATRWAEFYREYQSFQQWIHKLDTDISNINPFIGNLGSVRIQLQKMKVFYTFCILLIYFIEIKYVLKNKMMIKLLKDCVC